MGAGPSGTSVMPAVPEPPPRWSARAQVPAPEQLAGADWPEVCSEWEEEEPPRPHRALAPVLITLLVLVLLAIIALGIWLVVRSQDGGTPTPTDTGQPAGTSQSASTTPPPTATTPTTPPVTAPGPVAIPDVAGLDFNTAAERLRSLGFDVVRTNESSTSVPTGIVIRTDPAAGTRLLTPSTIAIIVSSGPAPTTPAPTRTRQPPTPTQSG